MSDDSSILRNRLMIANNLAVLAKEKCMITAILSGKNTLLTSVIEVDSKKGIVFLDTSASDKINELCVNSRRVQFSTVFNGVKVAFSSEKLTKAKYKSYDAFTMEIPSSLYWFDRRGSYRVPVSKIDPAVCKIIVPPPPENAKPEQIAYFDQLTSMIRQQLADQIETNLMNEYIDFEKSLIKMTVEQKIKAKREREQLEKEREMNPIVPDENLVNVFELPLIDLSMTGCSLMNNYPNFSYFLKKSLGYENCVLVFPEYGQASVNFEIMLQRQIEDHEDKLHNYHEFVGLKFIDSSQSTESSIFRYIQAMDRLMKNRQEVDLI